MTDPTVLRAARWADVDAGEVRSPAVIVVDGERITAVNPEGPLPDSTTVIDLGDLTLLPGLMDMELNLLIGGPGGPEGLPSPMHGVQDDPAYRTLRGAVNARTTLDAGFTTVRNLGLMVKTGGYLLDVALQRAIDQGWHVGPRIVPAGHAVTPYGGHLDPTVFQRLAPGIMPLSVAEGHRQRCARRDRLRALPDPARRQADQGVCSGGVMSHSTAPGAQQYLRRGVRRDRRRGAPRRGAGRRARRRRQRDPRLHPRRNRLHRARLPGDRRHDPDDGRPRHLPGLHHLSDRGDGDRPDRARSCARRPTTVFPRAKSMLPKAIAAGVRIACGTDAPAIPHGQNAKELCALVDRGMTPMQAIRAATVTSRRAHRRRRRARPARAGLPRRHHRRARRPLPDIATTLDVSLRYEKRPDLQALSGRARR